MTLLCVPIFVETIPQAAADAREARDRGADIVEFRLDSFYTGKDDPAQSPAIATLVAECPLPCVATCRPVLEGGQYDGPESARLNLLAQLAGGTVPPTYIDCELAAYTRGDAPDHPGVSKTTIDVAVAASATSLILSAHDFHTRPADFSRVVERMRAQDNAGVIKVAYRARSLRDNLELLDLLAERAKPTIALGMGPFGLMSRVLAPKFDGFLTFAALRRDAATAPGQPVIGELLDVYRFRSIGSATRVFGIVGWPVEHSMSPLVHNAGFEAAAFDAVYLPMPVAPEYVAFKATLLDFVEHINLDFTGCSVTIPHKEHLVRLAREAAAEGDDRWSLDGLSDRCGAANTLIVKRDTKGRAVNLRVVNTDGPAAVAALAEQMPLGPDPSRRLIALLGTGGTTRALAAAFLQEGVRVAIVSREKRRAEKLADQLRAAKDDHVVALDAASLGPLRVDAVINCTPVGMKHGPSPDASPLDEPALTALPKACVVMDAVYNPVRTPLLRHAAARGLTTVDGVRMFVHQAAAQFQAWTNVKAPTALFDRVTREALG